MSLVVWSFDFQLHLLNSGISPGTSWIPFPDAGPGNLDAVNWNNHRVHVVCFSLLKNHCPLLPGVQSLNNHYFVSLKKKISWTCMFVEDIERGMLKKFLPHY